MATLNNLAVIIGSAKSGTTALAHHLGKRPDMVLGQQKEPRYFTDFSSREWSGPASDGFIKTLISDPDQYVANFPDLQPHQWAIDGSTDYAWCAATPERLAAQAQTSRLRLICVVRDPIDRALSEYNHTLRHGWEVLSFAQALDAEEERIAKGWHPLFYHKRRSKICADLERYSGLFGRDLLILDYAELKDTSALLQKVSAFLGIPHFPSKEMEVKNQSFLPKNAIAARLLKSPALSAVARSLLPTSLRRTLRKSLHTNARNKQTVRPEEIQMLRNQLADEIARSIDSPLIPTDHWTSARGSQSPGQRKP